MAGHFDAAREALDGAVAGERRYADDEIAALVTAAGFSLRAVHGVRVFGDLVPSTLLDLEPGAVSGLLDLERAVAERPEYRAIATRLHLLAVRD
jgi:hypothetical protein